MSRGLQPYADINPDDLLGHLQSNHRLVQPINCPDSLSVFPVRANLVTILFSRFKIMSLSWIASVDQRPSMTSLLQSLMDFYGQLARFI